MSDWRNDAACRARRPARMFPAAPLVAELERRTPAGDSVSQYTVMTLGVTREAYFRWRNGTALFRVNADRYAIALGLHPSALWPEWFEDAA